MYSGFVATNFSNLFRPRPTRSFIVVHKTTVATTSDGIALRPSIKRRPTMGSWRSQSIRSAVLRWYVFVMKRGLPKIGVVVQSSCSRCGVQVHWRVTDIDTQRTEVEPLDTPTSFACDHWEEHHKATFRAPMNPSGQSRAGVVSATVLTKPPAFTVAQPVVRDR